MQVKQVTHSTTLLNANETRAFIVCTTSAQWFTKLLREGYRHCYMILWDGYQWLVADKNTLSLDIQVLTFINGRVIQDGDDIIGELLESEGISEIVEVDIHATRARYRHTTGNHLVSLIRPQTCVENVKNLLGMNTLYPFTPNQLIREVKRWESQY